MRRVLFVGMALVTLACGVGGDASFEVFEPIDEEEETLTPTFRGGVLKILRKTDSAHMCSSDCHIGSNPTRELAFDGDDATVYAELLEERQSGRAVNVANPAASPLLVFPLAGMPNHPKEPWGSPDAIEYQIIEAWIVAGANFD